MTATAQSVVDVYDAFYRGDLDARHARYAIMDLTGCSAFQGFRVIDAGLSVTLNPFDADALQAWTDAIQAVLA